MKKVKHIHFENTREWRAWLEKNHLKEEKVGTIHYKRHTGRPAMTHREAMNEAISFGWIDTIIKRIDDKKYLRYFVKRGEKANWSSSTVGYARELIKQGRMSPAGLIALKKGLKRPLLDEGISKNPKIPRDLRDELDKNEEASKNFKNFPPSARKMYLRWLERTKGSETRNKRIIEIIRRAAVNKKAFV